MNSTSTAQQSRVLTLAKQPALGFSVIGGGPSSIIVSRVQSGSEASQLGLQVGDRLLALNGQSLAGKSLAQLRGLLQAADAQLVFEVKATNSADLFRANSVARTTRPKSASAFSYASYSTANTAKATTPSSTNAAAAAAAAACASSTATASAGLRRVSAAPSSAAVAAIAASTPRPSSASSATTTRTTSAAATAATSTPWRKATTSATVPNTPSTAHTSTTTSASTPGQTGLRNWRAMTTTAATTTTTTTSSSAAAAPTPSRLANSSSKVAAAFNKFAAADNATRTGGALSAASDSSKASGETETVAHRRATQTQSMLVVDDVQVPMRRHTLTNERKSFGFGSSAAQKRLSVADRIKMLELSGMDPTTGSDSDNSTSATTTTSTANNNNNNNNNAGGRPRVASWCLPSTSTNTSSSTSANTSNTSNIHTTTTNNTVKNNVGGRNNSDSLVVSKDGSHILALNKRNIATLQFARDAQTGSLGFAVIGGAPSAAPLTVAKVEENSAAAFSGLQPGDILLEVNGVRLRGVAHDEAISILKKTASPIVLKTSRRGSPTTSSRTSDQDLLSNTNTAATTVPAVTLVSPESSL